MVIRINKDQNPPSKLDIPNIPYIIIVENTTRIPFQEKAFCGNGFGNFTESIFPRPRTTNITMTE